MKIIKTQKTEKWNSGELIVECVTTAYIEKIEPGVYRDYKTIRTWRYFSKGRI